MIVMSMAEQKIHITFHFQNHKVNVNQIHNFIPGPCYTMERSPSHPFGLM